MKKRIITCVMIIALLALTVSGMSVVSAFAEESESSDIYKAENFTEYPADDWQISPASDINYVTTGVTKYHELTITADGLSEGNHGSHPPYYYGALSIIQPGVEYENFTFELVFRVANAEASDRWLGVVYHTQYVSENVPVTGYIMNYRVNGKNAYSGVNASKAFSDTDEIGAGQKLADDTVAPVLSDGKYHTLTVTMEGTVAKHYIDGHLVRTAPAADKDTHLGGAHTSGGFALIVNRMTLNVRSCTISREVNEPAEPIQPMEAPGIDNTLVTTYRDADIRIVNAPTVVADVTDAATLAALTQKEKRPSNAIFRFDKDYKVTDSAGNVLDSFDTVYASLDHGIIPVLQVQTEQEADAAIAYLKDENNILDLAVLSSDPALLKKIKTANSKIRAIAEFAEEDFYEGENFKPYNLVSVANRNFASVVVIPQSMATIDTVRYLQGRFKTVWVRVGNGALDLYNAINSGAYGVIVSDTDKTYEALCGYDKNTFSRTAFNVGHRGLNYLPYNENSVSCIQAAIAGGATHLEVDVHLTKDNRILVMHDDTLWRTTTCTDKSIAIRDLTLEQIRSRYTFPDGEQIPVLEDIFEVLQEHKDVVLVLELKAGNAIAQEISELLGTGEGQYDVIDQLVVISFATDLLTNMKNILPDVPTALLKNTANKTTLAADLLSMGTCNTVLDISYGSTDTEYDQAYLRDRGIMGWYWTFLTVEDLERMMNRGHIGLTNNVADKVADRVYKVEGQEVTKSLLRKGSSVTLTVTSYNGKTKSDWGVVRYLEEYDDHWDVIAAYTVGDAWYYTQSYVIEKTQPEEPPAHTHTFATEWSNNETEHWHAATCEHTGEVSDKAAHTYADGKCSVCGKAQSAAHTHTFATEWSNNETEHWHAATCEHTSEVSGKAAHTYADGKCSVCGKAQSQNDSGKSGCKSSVAATSLLGALLALSACAVLTMRKRKA